MMAGPEPLPVTQEVAGSTPVHPASLDGVALLPRTDISHRECRTLSLNAPANPAAVLFRRRMRSETPAQQRND